MKQYLFIEHADSSFYGRGPWKIERVLNTGWLKMVPVQEGFAYGSHVIVDPMTFPETFVEVKSDASI